MNKEEIDYWLKLFSDNNYAFMSKDGKKITLFKVFAKLKKLQQENKELKKQVKDKTEDYRRMKDNFDSKIDVLTEIETQQKEFIKYLEDEIKQNTPNLKQKHYNEDGINDYDVENPSCIKVQPTYKSFKEILQKYKEIIGVLDETN